MAKSPQEIEKAKLDKAAKDRERRTQKRATPASTPTMMREAFKDLDAIDILDRRLTNPEADLVLPIRLKGEPSHVDDPHGHHRTWYLRWFNTSIPNRFHTVTASLGYTPVKWDELQDREIVSNAFTSSEQVRRGDRGTEVLCKMPMTYYTAIKAKQRGKHDRAMTPKALRAAIEREAAKAGLDPDDHGQATIKEYAATAVSSLDEQT
jgi:hypothetical protein